MEKEVRKSQFVGTRIWNIEDWRLILWFGDSELYFKFKVIWFEIFSSSLLAEEWIHMRFFCCYETAWVSIDGECQFVPVLQCTQTPTISRAESSSYNAKIDYFKLTEEKLQTDCKLHIRFWLEERWKRNREWDSIPWYKLPVSEEDQMSAFGFTVCNSLVHTAD